MSSKFQEHDLKTAICEIGRRMYDKSLVAATDGNISARTEDGILITPSGVCKGDLTPDMILKVGLDGELKEGNGLPSSEMKMHLRIYISAPQFKAAIHAHPPYATAFAVAGRTFSSLSYPTSYAVFGEVPLARYAVASTDELAASIEPFVMAGKRVILMENHGALTCGLSVLDAYYLMERLESHAKIDYLANHLGGARELTDEERQRFIELDVHRMV